MKGRLKPFQDEIERINLGAQSHIAKVESNFADALELEQKLVLSQGRHDCNGCGYSWRDEIAEVKKLLEYESNWRKAAEEEIEYFKSQLGKYTQAEIGGEGEIIKLRRILEDEAHQNKKLEELILS